MPINLIHLRAFHTVAAHGSFVRAADALHVSQPTLSEQVKALEHRYGSQLFERRGRQIMLTPLGEDLYALSLRLFDIEAQAEHLLASSDEVRVGRLRVASDSPGYAMPLLAAMARDHPGVETSLSTGNADRVLAALHAYRADIAYIANVSADPRLTSWPLLRTNLVAIVSPEHVWSRRSQVTADELVKARVVLREPGSMTRHIFAQALTEARLTVDDVIEVDSREAVMAAAAFGVGVGLVAEDEIAGPPDRPHGVNDTKLVSLRIDGLKLDITEYLVCLADRASLPIVRTACQLALTLA